MVGSTAADRERRLVAGPAAWPVLVPSAHSATLKLLFDQNLAPRLARSLADLYANSAHVRELELAARSGAGRTRPPSSFCRRGKATPAAAFDKDA